MGDGLTRRRILQGIGSGTAAALAGCNTGNNPGNNRGDNPGTSGQTDTTTKTEDPREYSLNLQDTLKYDLTSLPTADLDTHDQEHIDENYSAPLQGKLEWSDGETSIQKLLNGETQGLEGIANASLTAQHKDTIQPEYDYFNTNAMTKAYRFPDRKNVRAELNFENGETFTTTGTRKEVLETLSQKRRELAGTYRDVTSYSLEETEKTQINSTEEKENVELGKIPEYEVFDGDTLQLEIELENGETLTASTEVQKQLPESYRKDVRTPEDFDTGLEDYTTPYRFDTHRFDHDLFHTVRKDSVFFRANSGLDEEKTLEDEISFDRLENFYKENKDGMNETQLKRYMVALARGEMIEKGIQPETSEAADMHAVYEEAILRELNNRGVTPWEEIFFSGYDTTGKGGGHGRVAAYIGGDMHEDVLEKGENPGEDDTWYMVGSTAAEVEPPSNFHESFMVDGKKEDFVSPIAEIWNTERNDRPGYNTLDSFEQKMFSSNNTVLGFPEVRGYLSNGIVSNKYFIQRALKNIRDNEEWESFMIPAEVAADTGIGREGGGEHTRSTILAAGEEDDAPMLIDVPFNPTEDNMPAKRVLEDEDFQDPEVIQDELLKSSD